MKVLSICASLRKASWNRQLLANALQFAANADAQLDLLDLHDYPLLAFDGDVEEQTLKTPVVQKLAERFRNADAIILATPEYNYSYPGHFKNTFDWLSRLRPMPFTKKPLLLMSASPSLVGGNRGLWALRVPLEACGIFVYPDMFSLSQAHEAFDENAKLKNAESAKRLENLVGDFLKWAKAHNQAKL